MGIDTGIRWRTKTIRVDIDTGEVLTEFKAKTEYKKHKTTKNATLNKNKSAGFIEYTIEYRKDPQGRIFN